MTNGVFRSESRVLLVQMEDKLYGSATVSFLWNNVKFALNQSLYIKLI